MKETHMKVRLTFTTPILGSAPGNEDIYRTYIASKAPDARKMEQDIEDYGVEGVAEQGKMVSETPLDELESYWQEAKR